MMVTTMLKADTLKLVYFACFHSVMSYGTIFYRNSEDSKRVFIIQKKLIRTAGAERRVSCRELLKKFNILPLASEFLLSVLSFVVDNMGKFQTNSCIHNTNTRHKHISMS
jgi:hypothetical protein